MLELGGGQAYSQQASCKQRAQIYVNSESVPVKQLLRPLQHSGCTHCCSACSTRHIWPVLLLLFCWLRPLLLRQRLWLHNSWQTPANHVKMMELSVGYYNSVLPA
jgi:hypothetical protein